MKAVVMAGGFGTRIQPLTDTLPKPMLPIANVPMMAHVMMKLKNIGITEFIVLLYYKPEIIKEYFGDGSKFGMTITYIVPDDDYGTAGAVKLAQPYIGSDNFIVISGDLVTDFDFEKIVAFHKEKKAPLSITLTRVDNPLEFGVVIANDEGRIEKFLEKPSWGEVFSDTINTGIYIIEPHILEYIPANENFDFGKNLFKLLMQEDVPMYAGNAKGYWRDVGNPESYREVHADIFAGKVGVHMPSIVEHFADGVVYSNTPVVIDKSIQIIGTVVLGDNVTLHKGVVLNNVILADNITIGKESKLRNTVVWHDVHIGKKVIIENSVVCHDNTIGNNSKAKAGMILANGCEIGQLVSIENDVTIWPNKVIEDAAIVSNNLILGSKYKNSLIERGRVVGKTNVEISCEMMTKLAEAFGAQLPIGAKVLVARDYQKSSRMLKRAFLGGLLSAGVDVIDYNAMPSAVLRCSLSAQDEYIAGAHFRQNIEDPTSTVITFYNHKGLRIDHEMAKKIEKAFFKETFRRVNVSHIGTIIESIHDKEYAHYKHHLEAVLESHKFKTNNRRIAIDVMHGMAAEVFTEILVDMSVEHVMFNAHANEQRLFNVNTLIKRSTEDMQNVIKALKLDMGFMLYPYGQRMQMFCDKGELLDKQSALNVVLALFDKEAASLGVIKRVLLPVWASDFVTFEHLDISFGLYQTLDYKTLKTYDLIATSGGNFAFTEFATHRDAMYSTLKIIEMVSRHDVMLSKLRSTLPVCYYDSYSLSCKQSLKGTMMRKFLEDSQGKRASTQEGVKIWLNNHAWVLMIPDQYHDRLNLYIQASTQEEGEAIKQEYNAKIEKWSTQDAK